MGGDRMSHGVTMAAALMVSRSAGAGESVQGMGVGVSRRKALIVAGVVLKA